MTPHSSFRNCILARRSSSVRVPLRPPRPNLTQQLEDEESTSARSISESSEGAGKVTQQLEPEEDPRKLGPEESPSVLESCGWEALLALGGSRGGRGGGEGRGGICGGRKATY